VENEEYRQRDASEARGVVPLYFFAEIENRENGKDREGDHFLNGLELRGVELPSPAVIERCGGALPTNRGAIRQAVFPV
jgi:hypothetical protein